MRESLRALDLTRSNRKYIETLIEDYSLFRGQLIWRTEELPKLQQLCMAVLGLTEHDIFTANTSDDLEREIRNKVKGLNSEQIKEICYVLTLAVGDDEND